MTPADQYESIDAFAADNRDLLVRVLRHSNDPYARACAWAMLDAGSDPPDLDQLERELAALKSAA